MGVSACVCREPQDDDKDRQLGPQRERGVLCLGSRECNKPDLLYRITFSTEEPLSAEGEATLAMLQLWYSDGDRMPRDGVRVEAMERKVISAFEQLITKKSPSVLDLVPPLVALLLNVKDSTIRESIWNGIARRAVRVEPAMAHRFFWALLSHKNSPQASPMTKKNAEAMLSDIQACWCNVNPQGQTGVTALVYLVQRLVSIGNDLVKAQGKERRSELLKIKLEEVNKELAAWQRSGAPVPALMLTSEPRPNTGVTLLRLAPDEGFVLSSKERTPFHILLEVEELEFNMADAEQFYDAEQDLEASVRDANKSTNEGNYWGSFSTRFELFRSAVADRMLTFPSLPAAAEQKKDSPTTRPSKSPEMRPSGSRSPGRANSKGKSSSGSASGHRSPSNDSNKRHDSLDSTGGLGDPDMDSDEEEVNTYLKERDRKPKGLFKKETYEQVVKRVRRNSLLGQLRNWRVVSLIVKSNADDVRQEELACRLLRWFQRVFERHKLKLWLRPFGIIATDHDSGVLETVPNAISIDSLKKIYGEEWISLKAYFEQAFPQVELGAAFGAGRLPGKRDHQSWHRSNSGRMDPMSEEDMTAHEKSLKWVPLNRAVRNYVRSMAAYSIVCFVLAIRDRHNGNILLDDEGHIIHVDFGFMLSGAPGGVAVQKMGGFEPSRGFKLTSEYTDVMGGNRSRMFQIFRDQVCKGLAAVRKEAPELLALLQLAMLGPENHSMPCFQHPTGRPSAVLDDVRHRLKLPLNNRQEPISDLDFHVYCNSVIDLSVDNWRSKWYDRYQYIANGLL